MLSMLGKNFRGHFEIFFLFFPRKKDFTFLRRQFAWNVKAYFLGKIRKTIISLSSAEFAHSVLCVNPILTDRPD